MNYRLSYLPYVLTLLYSMNVSVKATTQHDEHITHKTIHVLFIGNSYTFYNELPWLLHELAVSDHDDREVETERIVMGGKNLKYHWEEGKAQEAIRREHWDYVVLQEYSLGALTAPDSMKKYVRLFHEEISKVHAQTVLYLTWARQYRPQSQDSINNVTFRIAKEMGALVAPVGPAWQSAMKEDTRIMLYDTDGSHPNAAGSYMAACVFYALFYNRSPHGLTCSICQKKDGRDIPLVDLAEPEATFIQRVAWETVLKLRAHTGRTP